MIFFHKENYYIALKIKTIKLFLKNIFPEKTKKITKTHTLVRFLFVNNC